MTMRITVSSVLSCMDTPASNPTSTQGQLELVVTLPLLVFLEQRCRHIDCLSSGGKRNSGYDGPGKGR